MAYGYLAINEDINEYIPDELIREGAFALKWTRNINQNKVDTENCMRSAEGCEKFTLYLQTLNRVKL